MMKCPLCSAEFTREEMACHTGCPFNSSCGVICCPNCGYDYVEESKIVNFFRKFMETKDGKAIRKT